ncbi:MAG: hypothetical protein O2873_08070 [Proteobacteria bacterium]|nr:hypothetical protein [Pseudomonadota bacterium]
MSYSARWYGVDILTLNQTAGALGDMIADVTAGPDSQPDQN